MFYQFLPLYTIQKLEVKLFVQHFVNKIHEIPTFFAKKFIVQVLYYSQRVVHIYVETREERV